MKSVLSERSVALPVRRRLECDDDADAIDKAKRLRDGNALEVWTARPKCRVFIEAPIVR